MHVPYIMRCALCVMESVFCVDYCHFAITHRHTIGLPGASVHLVCRSEQRGKDAVEKIVQSTKNEDVHLHVADMADAAAVQAVAESFVSSGSPLDVLVNNAGKPCLALAC